MLACRCNRYVSAIILIRIKLNNSRFVENLWLCIYHKIMVYPEKRSELLFFYYSLLPFKCFVTQRKLGEIFLTAVFISLILFALRQYP